MALFGFKMEIGIRSVDQAHLWAACGSGEMVLGEIVRAGQGVSGLRRDRRSAVLPLL